MTVDDEWLTERAAILEFDAGLSRAEADRQAVAMLLMLQEGRDAVQTAAGYGYAGKSKSAEPMVL